LILRKIIENAAPDVIIKAKIHQIRFSLELLARWGSLQRSPGPLARFKGPTSKGRRMGRKGKRGV